MKASKSVVRWAALVSVMACATTLAGAGGVSASTTTPPYQTFCAGVLNGSLLNNTSPSSLSEALPITVTSANAFLPYYKVFLRNLQAALSDFETAEKAAPVASLANSWSKANASYKTEISYFKTALATLVKVAKTKNASLIPAISTALTKATAAAFAANAPFISDLGVQIRLCAPWATAKESVQNVVIDLANIAGDTGGGLTTLSELQKVIRKQPSSPRVAFVSSIPTTGALKSATLSVTTSKYRVYTCVSFYRSMPQSAVPSICTH